MYFVNAIQSSENFAMRVNLYCIHFIEEHVKAKRSQWTSWIKKQKPGFLGYGYLASEGGVAEW